MLVLSRRTNETIVLPQLDVTLQVVKVKGNQVRLAISAPDCIRILRGEVADEGGFGEMTGPLPELNSTPPQTAFVPVMA